MSETAWFKVYLRRGGLSHTFEVKAWDERDARCSAADAFPGWRVVEVVRDND